VNNTRSMRFRIISCNFFHQLCQFAPHGCHTEAPTSLPTVYRQRDVPVVQGTISRVICWQDCFFPSEALVYSQKQTGVSQIRFNSPGYPVYVYLASNSNPELDQFPGHFNVHSTLSLLFGPVSGPSWPSVL
jgi:hypothetical protein